MRELTFFTSNSVKLAHARYIAEPYPVRIKGFRQRTYHANYSEPRTLTRDKLLEASYRSALEQCSKAGISVDTHPFILEDTSVRVEALSNPETEIPGLDVKFWMQEQTFKNLDADLKNRGNNRRASVRSDIVLHIPASLRSAWSASKEYLVFTGIQEGSIVHREEPFSTNLVYPWLDNESFNRWFKPDGANAPFGALPIATANRMDFRRKSFGKLFTFLESRWLNSRNALQIELPLDHRPNLVFAGYTCAGKTTASQNLARRFGYLHVEASDFMYLSYYYRHGYKGTVEIGDFAERALLEKPEIASEKINEYLLDLGSPPVVVSGFRAPEEVDLLRRQLTIQGRSLELIFIEADSVVRYQRLKLRGRPGDDIGIVEFRERDMQQARMGLENLRKLADRTIMNVGSRNSFLDEVDRLASGVREDDIDVVATLAKLKEAREIGLEAAILLALLSEWAESENRHFLSTTEIARKINSLFEGIPPKHKDNVSRYFNQDFYAYYEISESIGRATRRYRLSNTGYGRAVGVLRELTKRPAGH